MRTEPSKLRENKLRRIANREGLRLVKSRTRNPDALDFGLYALIDLQTNGLVSSATVDGRACSWDLDDVEDYLAK